MLLTEMPCVNFANLAELYTTTTSYLLGAMSKRVNNYEHMTFDLFSNPMTSTINSNKSSLLSTQSSYTSVNI